MVKLQFFLPPDLELYLNEKIKYANERDTRILEFLLVGDETHLLDTVLASYNMTLISSRYDHETRCMFYEALRKGW